MIESRKVGKRGKVIKLNEVPGAVALEYRISPDPELVEGEGSKLTSS